MNVLALFRSIRAFVFDIDGVLTDGSLLVTEDGGLLRRMNVKDGFALQWAVKQGYEVVVISGGKSEAVQLRLTKLGLKQVFIGVEDKAALLRQLMKEHHWTKEQVLYMGDDIPDRECLQLSGIAACPRDAVSDIRVMCAYVSPFEGGKGCVRDVVEKALKLQGKWLMG